MALTGRRCSVVVLIGVFKFLLESDSGSEVGIFSIMVMICACKGARGCKAGACCCVNVN
jgi:hypothetical protein